MLGYVVFSVGTVNYCGLQVIDAFTARTSLKRVWSKLVLFLLHYTMGNGIKKNTFNSIVCRVIVGCGP